MALRRRSALIILAMLAALVVVPQASTKPVAKPTPAKEFRITLTFEQTRKWTHFYEQRSPDCTRTTHGNGQEVVKMTGTGSVGLPVRNGRVPVGLYPAGMTLTGTWSRTGQSSIDRGGPDCGPGGPTTETEPVDGCGTFKIPLQFANLEVNPRGARLTWESGKSPAFTGNCPNFDGANDIAPGQKSLPGSQFQKMTLRFPSRLRNPKRAVATGILTDSATETCATLNGGTCGSDTTYDATGSVEAKAKATLVRHGR